MNSQADSSDKQLARALGRTLGTFHNVTYYAPEIKAFADLGLPEYWRAYMAYRSAPMGLVPPSVVTSTFYNFAPAVVEAGIPSAWQTTTPAEVLSFRDVCITGVLDRTLEDDHLPAISEAADLALRGILSVDAGARPLFAAHRELPIPDDPRLRLWFATTLWREHRGDGHNLALALAGIDGIECHVLLAGRGVADKDTILKIRGWTSSEWDAALDRLVARNLVNTAGEITDQGRALRSDIEAQTDALAASPRSVLGTETAQRLVSLVEPLVGVLVESGAVAARWPPPKPPR